MRFSLAAALTVAFLVVSLAPLIARADDATPPPKPLIEQRGLPMSAQEAMDRITFHPFVPQNYTAISTRQADTSISCASGRLPGARSTATLR